MSAAAIAAGIGALGNIAGSIVSNKMNLSDNKKFFDYTLPKNQQAQYEMIANSPSLLVQGYKRAGLNPASVSSSYEGSGATGETGVTTAPINVDPVGTYMQLKQLEMNEEINGANVRKANAEAQNVEKQNQWFDQLQQQNLNSQKAQEDLLKNQSNEVKELLPGKIKEQSSNINLTDLKASYQDSLNDAMEKEYDFDGKKVKGKDIPNFKELFALEMAQKTLGVDWYNAITSRQSLDRDWKAVLTKEWFAPLIRDLSGDVSSLSPEIKKIFRDTVDSVNNTLTGIRQFQEDTKPVRDFFSNPYGNVKKYFTEKSAEATKPFKDWFNKFKENTRNGKYW